MIHLTSKTRAHYDPAGLLERIKAALATIAPEDQKLAVAQLAPLDQFHIRGIDATTELARPAGVDSGTRVLDLGCGIGGPARHLVTAFGCMVTGIDLSSSFIETAIYLTARCGLSDRINFHVGDALHLPFKDGAFDVVFLQHVAMNIRDRGALYAEVHRVLRPRGRFVTYDLVRSGGGVVYPVPWARDASTSFLLSEKETRAELERSGFRPVVWRDDSEIALEWFETTGNGSAPNGLTLGLLLGQDFQEMRANVVRNIRENRIGVLSAVLTIDKNRPAIP